MFIQTEDTPNPAALKFLPGRLVQGDAPPADFPNADAAMASPLATALFQIEGVISVFFGQDFIAITKGEAHEWQHLKPSLLSVIMEHFVHERPLWHEGQALKTPEALADSDDNAVVAAIKQVLDTRVRPAVAQDGGDVVFHSFEDGVVALYMRGACAGCPSATETLKGGIENLLKHYIPEVSSVRAVI